MTNAMGRSPSCKARLRTTGAVSESFTGRTPYSGARLPGCYEPKPRQVLVRGACAGMSSAASGRAFALLEHEVKRILT